ncbi:unnamed protein product [Cercospora beticola]|nr:unnamed protein product [Cercospora beticola]
MLMRSKLLQDLRRYIDRETLCNSGGYLASEKHAFVLTAFPAVAAWSQVLAEKEEHHMMLGWSGSICRSVLTSLYTASHRLATKARLEFWLVSSNLVVCLSAGNSSQRL